MEKKQPTAEVISALESKVLGRVEALVPIIERLQRTKHIVRAYQQAKISILALKELEARSTKDSFSAEKSHRMSDEEDVVSGFEKLDGILSLAKEIRAGSNKSSKQSGPQDVQKDKSGKTTGRQSLRDALAVKDDATKTADTADNNLAKPSPQELFLTDLHAQLHYLSRHRIAVSPSKLYMNRLKYCEEAKFLTKLLIRPEQPNSVLFQVIHPSLPQLDTNERHEAHFSAPFVTGDSLIVRLAQQFRSLIVSYERYMKVRVSHETFKVTLLSVEDKKAMIALWMRGRKLLDLYKHYEKTRKNLPCTCESCALSRKNAVVSADAATIVNRTTPFCTPLPLPSARTDGDSSSAVIGSKSKSKSKPPSGGSESSNAWANTCKPRVEAFHEAYQSKILLIAESAVGQEQLKGTIQSLKACCEESANRAKQGQIIAAGTGGADAAFVGRWAESLKQFRLVYSLLFNEAQELNHCMFINKA